MSPTPTAASAALPIMLTRSAVLPAVAAPTLSPTGEPAFTVSQLQNQIWACSRCASRLFSMEGQAALDFGARQL
jgi:hypothetical protein